MLGVCVCAALCAGAQEPPTAVSDMQKAVEEFKIETKNLGFRADSPPKATVSGGKFSQFHGRIFENFRNDFLDAIPHEVVQRGGDKSLLRRNQFGFNVSGPVIIPKLYNGGRTTFFSVSYEGMRENIGRSYLRTIPTVPERTGDFSQVVDYSGEPLQIFDPATTRQNPNYDKSQPVSRDNLEFLRDPFPNNQIGGSKIDPVALKMLAYYPTPNTDAGPFYRNNYFSLFPETNTANGMIFKVDHTFLAKNRITTSYAFTNGFGGQAHFYDTLADPGPADRTFSNRRGSVEYVYTASPQFVNTATAEVYVDDYSQETPGDQMPAQLGIPGLDGNPFPLVQIQPYLSMGRTNPQLTVDRNTFVYTDAVSLKRGKHNLRGVAQFTRLQEKSYAPSYPSGYFQFDAGYTSLPGIVNTGHAFSSFLLGAAGWAQVSDVVSPSYFRNWRTNLAVQDTWEPMQGLTLSFGINLEISASRSEKYDRQSTIDLSAPNPASPHEGALVFAGMGGYGSQFQPVKASPQPNFSLAWSPSGSRKQVARAYYAMSFQAYPIYGGQWGTQGYTGSYDYYSQNDQLFPALTLSGGVPPPLFPLPDLRPEAANDHNGDLMNTSGSLPRYQGAGASYERELPRQFVVTGALGFGWGQHLFVGWGAVNPNAIPLEDLSYRDQLNFTPFNRSLRPYPQYLSFNVYSQWPGGTYFREAASIRVEKRTSQGLSLNGTYEYSRQYDDYSGPYGTQDYFNRHNEWGLTAYNNPHRLSLSYMYELPIGVNKPYLAYPDWRRYITSGWAISGMSSISSGTPLALHPQFNNTGGVVESLRRRSTAGHRSAASRIKAPISGSTPTPSFHPADFAIGTAARTHPVSAQPHQPKS